MKNKFTIVDVTSPNKDGCDHLIVKVKYKDVNENFEEEICYHLTDFNDIDVSKNETELFKFLHQKCKEKKIKKILLRGSKTRKTFNYGVKFS